MKIPPRDWFEKFKSVSLEKGPVVDLLPAQLLLKLFKRTATRDMSRANHLWHPEARVSTHKCSCCNLSPVQKNEQQGDVALEFGALEPPLNEF